MVHDSLGFIGNSVLIGQLVQLIESFNVVSLVGQRDKYLESLEVSLDT